MRDALIATMGGVEGARWQTDDQLHLTLRFIGEVDRHVAEDVAASLGSVSHPGFALQLDGIGTFDRRGRIDSIWAGVTPHEPVRLLHAAVTRALTRAGIAPETRAFVPHITIARLTRGPASTKGMAIERLWPPPIEGRFDHFILYESQMGSSGSSYSMVERYPLG